MMKITVVDIAYVKEYTYIQTAFEKKKVSILSYIFVAHERFNGLPIGGKFR